MKIKYIFVSKPKKMQEKKNDQPAWEVHPGFTNLCYNVDASFFDIKIFVFLSREDYLIDCGHSYSTHHSLIIAFSMDGFRVVKIEMVVKQIDILITCTGMLLKPNIVSWNADNQGVISVSSSIFISKIQAICDK